MLVTYCRMTFVHIFAQIFISEGRMIFVQMLVTYDRMIFAEIFVTYDMVFVHILVTNDKMIFVHIMVTYGRLHVHKYWLLRVTGIFTHVDYLYYHDICKRVGYLQHNNMYTCWLLLTG